MRTCIRCSRSLEEAMFPRWGGKTNNACRQCLNATRTENRRKAGVKTRDEWRQYMRQYRKANKEKIILRQERFRKENAIRWLWRQLQKRKNVLVISRDQFLAGYTVPSTCPVLGIPLSFDLGRDNYPSVDRINPNRPYEKGNIAIISYRANMIKSVGSAKEHHMIADWLSVQGHAETPGKSLPNAPPLKVVVRFGRARERL